jgi:hypothetical protein
MSGARQKDHIVKKIIRIGVNPFNWTIFVHYGTGMLTEQLFGKHRTLPAAQRIAAHIAKSLGMTPTEWKAGWKPPRCRRCLRILDCHANSLLSGARRR